jgi:Divergent InlB B-repeat domain/Fibronectin type III domain
MATASWRRQRGVGDRGQLVAIIAALLIGAGSFCQAVDSVTLEWERNSEPDVVSYKVYYGRESGRPSESVPLGNVTTATITDLDDATTYYFTVTAINEFGLESGPSNEISYTTPDASAYVLTVNNGSGTGNYIPGTLVTVSASSAPEGQYFDRWVDDWVILANPWLLTTTATIPYQDVTITASYADLPTYALSVVNGTGSGDYLAGAEIPVWAHPPAPGEQFIGWSGDVSVLESPSSANTTVTMLSRSVTIAAEYSTLPREPPAYVQGNYSAPQTSLMTLEVPYDAAQSPGNLNVVIVGWRDARGQLVSVSDTSGNSYRLAVAPTSRGSVLTQAIYYAANIAGSSAGANTVTVTFSAPASSPDVRVLEYSGIDTVDPVDVVKAATGNSATSNSGLVTTTNPTDLLVAANMVRTSTSGPGARYTSRLSTAPNGDIVQDRLVTTTGSYRATASLTSSGPWIMQVVAFRAAQSSAP